jgi:hypothetical protein
MAHCLSSEARHQKSFEGISDKPHGEGAAEVFYRHSDSCCVALGTLHVTKAITTIFIFDHKCGHFSKENIPQMYWTDSVISLHAVYHLVLFCDCFSKFSAEVTAKMMLLQHIHFSMQCRGKHICTVEHLTHD